MTKEALIKILEGYEVFVDDDYGGSYQNIIAYTKDKKISKAFTSLGALQIIYTFEKMQKENQQLKEQLERSEKARKEGIEYVKSNANIYLNICGDKIGFLKENDGKTPIKLLDILDIDKGE